MLAVVVTAANVQDRDGAVPAIIAAHAAYSTLQLPWADRAYNGEAIAKVEQETGIEAEMVRHEEGHRGFSIVPRRWVVERGCRPSDPPRTARKSRTDRGGDRERAEVAMESSKRRRYTTEQREVVLADVRTLGVSSASKKHDVIASAASRSSRC